MSNIFLFCDGDERGAAVKSINALIFSVSIINIGNAFSQAAPDDQRVSVSRISDYELSIGIGNSEHRCQIDQEIIDINLSSDGQAVIISGTSFISIAELMHCRSDAVARAKKAAPHVGFLNDVNLKAGIYASLVPVSVNPMGFLAVVGRIGSDRNLINRPEFYRVGVGRSMFISEASSPTLSLDARYVSLDLHSCDWDGGEGVAVIEIHSGKQIKLSRTSCEKIFHFQ